MLFFSLILSNEKLLAYPFWIHVASAFPLGLLDTNILLLFIEILRPVPLQDVFLLQIQSVGVTSLTRTIFCLRICNYSDIYISMLFFSHTQMLMQIC
jgi:hypothetical protein